MKKNNSNRKIRVSKKELTLRSESKLFTSRIRHSIFPCRRGTRSLACGAVQGGKSVPAVIFGAICQPASITNQNSFPDYKPN